MVAMGCGTAWENVIFVTRVPFFTPLRWASSSTTLDSMRREPGIRVLRSGQSDRELRWIARRGLSIRSYTVRAESEPQFCVSTRSSELTVLLDGEAWFELGPARQQLRLRPDQGCVILRGTPHRMAVTEDARFLIIDIDLHETPREAGMILLPAIPPALSRAMPGLWDLRRLPSAAELSRWDEVVRGQPLTAVEGTHNTRRMLDVKSFLERHYTGPIDLQSLACRHGIDRYYLVRAFRRNFGAPPSAYIQFLRLEHFAWSLLRGEGEITRRACEAGYGDYSTFCRRIRQAFGRPPSELVETAPLCA
jgi:AraC-like DNA-binding protein/mannose-6-phosphate isomerase-like protein (cupin superfamily)